MISIPSIDLYDNKVVRLKKGQLSACTTYDLSPLEALQMLESNGAQRVHIVDLNGAFQKSPQLKVLEALGHSASIPLQTGGGIRQLKDIKDRLDMGYSSVVISSACFIDSAFLETALKSYSDKLILALDLLNNSIAIKGWTEDTGMNITTFITSKSIPAHIPLLVTDISKDGLLHGPSFDLYQSLIKSFDNPIMASGGIRGFNDIQKLSTLGLSYAIMGKAIYENTLSDLEVKQCLQNASFPV